MRLIRSKRLLREAEASAEVTHNHPEGIKGAQAVAAAIFMAHQKRPKEEIRTYINDAFGYKLNYSVVHIRPFYQFDVSCQGSVPEAIIAFLDSNSTEEAIRLAVSLGGDADTQASIAGAIAEAYYKDLSAEFIAQVYQRIPDPFIKVLDRFCTPLKRSLKTKQKVLSHTLLFIQITMKC